MDKTAYIYPGQRVKRKPSLKQRARRGLGLGGKALESLNEEFRRVVEQMNEVDRLTREEAEGLDILIKASQSLTRQRQYFAAASSLIQFHKKLNRISAEFKAFSQDIVKNHNRFFLRNLSQDDLRQLLGKNYDPRVLATPKVKAIKSTLFASSDFIKEGGIIGDWWHNIFTQQGRAMKSLESKFSNSFLTDLKRATKSLVDRSEEIFKFLLETFQELGDAWAARKIGDYVNVSKRFIDRFESYHTNFLQYYDEYVVPLQKEHQLMEQEKAQKEEEAAEQKNLASPNSGNTPWSFPGSFPAPPSLETGPFTRKLPNTFQQPVPNSLNPFESGKSNKSLTQSLDNLLSLPIDLVKRKEAPKSNKKPNTKPYPFDSGLPATGPQTPNELVHHPTWTQEQLKNWQKNNPNQKIVPPAVVLNPQKGFSLWQKQQQEKEQADTEKDIQEPEYELGPENEVASSQPTAKKTNPNFPAAPATQRSRLANFLIDLEKTNNLSKASQLLLDKSAQLDQENDLQGSLQLLALAEEILEKKSGIVDDLKNLAKVKKKELTSTPELSPKTVVSPPLKMEEEKIDPHLNFQHHSLTPVDLGLPEGRLNQLWKSVPFLADKTDFIVTSGAKEVIIQRLAHVLIHGGIDMTNMSIGFMDQLINGIKAAIPRGLLIGNAKCSTDSHRPNDCRIQVFSYLKINDFFPGRGLKNKVLKFVAVVRLDIITGKLALQRIDNCKIE